MTTRTAFEFCAVAAILLIAFAFPQLGNLKLRRLRRGFVGLARRKTLCCVLLGLTTFLLAAGVSLFVHKPAPWVHDDFSYLLAADTFMSGRLTNPTHPLWEHFETFHVINEPSYQSKYPVGQGLQLALGQILAGRPIVGVWISMAAAAAALCWMLQGWLPPRWALLGGLLGALHGPLLVWWSQMYWGGSLAMLGGALVFGSLPRLMSAPRLRTSLLLAFGLAVLANSRPYEGLLASLPVAIVLLVWLVRENRISVSVRLTQVVVPIASVLILTAGGMGYYNYRVTGDALKMPYQVWQETHGSARSIRATLFFWERAPAGLADQSRKPSSVPTQDELEAWVFDQPRAAIVKIARQWGFYLGPLLTMAILLVPRVLRRHRMVFAVTTILVVLTAIALQATPGFPHYTAPIACLVYLLVVQGLRYLRHWELGGQPAGRFLCRAIPVLCLVSLSLWIYTWGRLPRTDFPEVRQRIVDQLEHDGNRHLIVVRYAPDHDPHREWVYNRANIDDAKIIWARELNDDQNQELLEYFQDRQVWLWEPDNRWADLVPYTGAKMNEASDSRPASFTSIAP